MYICLFTQAKSGREMTNCILSLPLRNVTDKHLCSISSEKEEKILQSLRQENVMGTIIYPHNPKLRMNRDIALCRNPLGQETQKKTNFHLSPKCGPKGKMCPASKLLTEVHETRSPSKCESNH